VVREWTSTGETVSPAQLRRNMLRWSTIRLAAFSASPSNSCKLAAQVKCTFYFKIHVNNSDYVPLVNLIGILFQIRDDFQNLQDTQYTNNKGLCEDITEGKFSFPIIHAILSRPEDRQLISINPATTSPDTDILKQHTTSEEIKLYCIEYMKGTGSFAYTRRVLRELDFGARKEIENLSGNKGLTAILDRLRIESGDEVVV
jgi:Polyprenyl synthetase